MKHLQSQKKYDLIFISSLCVLAVFLFKDVYEMGMQFDEVYRKCNVFSIFLNGTCEFNQSIFSINFMGRDIPIMYKPYISSASIIPWIPVLLFDDPLVGIRTLYYIYFVFTLSLFYLSLKEYNRKIAILTTLLLLVSPLLFPNIRIGFSSTLQLIPVSILLLIKNKRVINCKTIFFVSFVFSLFANIEFYFIWVIVAILITSILFYYSFWRKILFNIKYILSALAGIILGLFNFILYNIFNGFPTVKILLTSIFASDVYNKAPIDYKEKLSFWEDIPNKIDLFSSYLGEYSFVFFLILLIFILALFMSIICLNKRKELDKINEYRIYLCPILITVLVLVFILISPNATGRHHFCYLAPYWALSYTCIPFLVIKLTSESNRKKIYKTITCILLLIVLLFSGLTTYSVINQSNESRGTGNFSPAIFDLREYLQENKINGDQMLFVNWGFHSQLYFLNKGDFKINEVVFKLYHKEQDVAFDALRTYFKNSKWNEFYFIAYDKISKTETNNFISFITQYGGSIIEKQKFYEIDGSEVFTLYKVENVNEIKRNIKPKQEKELLLSLETLGFSDIIDTNNISVVSKSAIFSYESYIEMTDRQTKLGEKIEVGMDLWLNKDQKIEDDSRIITKWNSWQEDMSFAISSKKESIVFIFSQDGSKWEGLFLKKDVIPVNQWNNLRITFNKGNLRVYVNDTLVGEKQFSLTNVFVGNTNLEVGRNMEGQIRNFYYNAN